MKNIARQPDSSHTSLADIAIRINAEHKAATDSARTAVQRALAAGEWLLEAKRRCPHGMWESWREANCSEISARTARAYMRVAQHCLDYPADASKLHELTFRGSLRQLASPKTATVAVLMEGDDVSWLPDGAGMLTCTIAAPDDGDTGPIYVQQSQRSPGFFHMWQIFESKPPNVQGGINGLLKPIRADAATHSFRNLFGRDPFKLSWIVLDAPPGAADEWIAEFHPPPWLEEKRKRSQGTGAAA